LLFDFQTFMMHAQYMKLAWSNHQLLRRGQSLTFFFVLLMGAQHNPTQVLAEIFLERLRHIHFNIFDPRLAQGNELELQFKLWRNSWMKKY
jgi:hypothetical protein